MNSIPLKILIVDDNEDHQILMEEQLVENSHNIDMVFVESGNECMLRLSKESYDAVIVDFNLPDMDGLGVLKEMNRKGYDYPVLMVTAFGDENIAVETMKLGAQDYIVKSEGFAEKLPEILYKVAHEYKLRKNNELTERKLKISESKYKALIDNMIDVVFTADNQFYPISFFIFFSRQVEIKIHRGHNSISKLLVNQFFYCFTIDTHHLIKSIDRGIRRHSLVPCFSGKLL